MKDLFKKAGEFASRAGTAAGNLMEDGVNALKADPKKTLETKIEALLKTDFNKANKYQTLKLIQEIIDLSIEIQTTDGSDRAIKDAHVAGKISGSAKEAGETVVAEAKGIYKEYLEWAEGDADKIYDVLKKHAEQNKDGKLSKENIEELKSDSLVWNFLSMIWAHVAKFFGIGTKDDVAKANDKLEVGKFTAKLADSEAFTKVQDKLPWK